MYPKHFFERFWESEQKNQLFVCMPFHNNCDERFETGKERAPEEHAYHWTSFGKEVMKYLGIPQFTLEQFKKERPEEYEAIKKANEEWVEKHTK